MVMVCCNRFTSLSSYINYIILIWEKSGKGKGKKEAPQVLERGFPPITKVTGFQPIYLSMNICADRLAALNMYANSGQTRMKRFIAFRDSAPNGGGSGMPCGACQEFFYQLNEANEDMEIMVDYEKRETVTLKELMPNWWGKERYAEAKSN